MGFWVSKAIYYLR